MVIDYIQLVQNVDFLSYFLYIFIELADFQDELMEYDEKSFPIDICLLGALVEKVIFACIGEISHTACEGIQIVIHNSTPNLGFEWACR